VIFICDYEVKEKLSQKEKDWYKIRVEDKSRVIFIDGKKEVF
jgi:plasmid maintenance system killer protein